MTAGPPMDADRWRRLKAVVGEVLESPAGERAGRLDAADLDTEDRGHAAALVAAYEREPSFLENAVPGSAGAAGSSAELRPGQRLDVYRVIRKIGEGGMGEVYEVEQEEPIRRRLALKLLRPGRRRDVARFLSERQMMASMAHRHVAQVYGAGAVGGRPYLALELLDAPPITDYCDRRRLGVEARLRLFIDVCHGVQHAHRRGIIHRDLKPTNILVATEDGGPVAKVIDFGISKALDGADHGHTENGQWLGTPDYMSPEQALGGSGLDTRSDVYSLGALLYEMLTGSRPIQVDPDEGLVA
ncbi:MAG: serine/threonine-protein kinase, partial [Acidobacteriota bacterium]